MSGSWTHVAIQVLLSVCAEDEIVEIKGRGVCVCVHVPPTRPLVNALYCTDPVLQYFMTIAKITHRPR